MLCWSSVLESIGDVETLVCSGDDVSLGLSEDFREHMADYIASASLQFPVALTDATQGMAGSSTHLFEILCSVIGRITALDSIDASTVNSAIAEQLRISGAISEDTKMQIT